MNMNKIVKGRVDLQGVQIELEGEPDALANVVKSVIGTTPEAKEAARKAKKAEYMKKWWEKNKKSSTTSSKGTKPKSSAYKNRHGYHKWTDHDVVSIAKLALEHGQEQEGFGARVYRMLRKEGDVKTRSKENVCVFANRVHRYIYHGHKKELNNNIVDILNNHGFSPREQRPSFFGPRAERPSFLGDVRDAPEEA